jgi:hypothetical protein
MNEAKLRDARNPEILDSVVKAKLRLKSAYPRRGRSENQFMPIKVRKEIECCIASERAAFVG